MSRASEIEALTMHVTDLLMFGHENARTRREISDKTGYSDRVVWEIIEIARDNGWLICNDQDGRGYYLGWTADEIERQYRRDRGRALSVLKRLKPFRHRLREEGRL
jgi:biotin operon repressor